MDKLFGTSKPKEKEPEVDINAPTLKETSQNVSRYGISKKRVVGRERQGYPGQGRRVQCPTRRGQEADGWREGHPSECSQVEGSLDSEAQEDVRHTTGSNNEPAVQRRPG